jgi:hypothetical protein
MLTLDAKRCPNLWHPLKEPVVAMRIEALLVLQTVFILVGEGIASAGDVGIAGAAVGRLAMVSDLWHNARQQSPDPFWYLNRSAAVALTMLKQWDGVNEVLPPLQRIAAATGSRHLAALVAAIQEEILAAQGGPAATHGQLLDSGYAGWSRLLSHRPVVRLE